MLPDPVLVLEDGSVYGGLFLAAIVCGFMAGIAFLMVQSSPLKPMKIIFASFGLLGAIGGWFGPALDVSQYEWFRWYDGLLFPIVVLITPDYYSTGSTLIALVIPAFIIVSALAIMLITLGKLCAPVSSPVESQNSDD